MSSAHNIMCYRGHCMRSATAKLERVYVFARARTVVPTRVDNEQKIKWANILNIALCSAANVNFCTLATQKYADKQSIYILVFFFLVAVVIGFFASNVKNIKRETWKWYQLRIIWVYKLNTKTQWSMSYFIRNEQKREWLKDRFFRLPMI